MTDIVFFKSIFIDKNLKHLTTLYKSFCVAFVRSIGLKTIRECKPKDWSNGSASLGLYLKITIFKSNRICVCMPINIQDVFSYDGITLGRIYTFVLLNICDKLNVNLTNFLDVNYNVFFFSKHKL